MIRLLARAALVAASAIVFAPSVGGTVNQNPGSNIQRDTGAGTDQGTTAATGDAADFGTVISAIQASGDTAQKVRNLGDVSNLRVVRVSDIANTDSVQALENALRQNREAVEELRSAVKENAALSRRLQQEDVQADEVVTATETGGQFVVYVR